MKINWLASYPKSGNTWVRAFLEAYEKGTVDINNMEVVIGDSIPYYYHQASPVPYENLDIYSWVAIRHSALLRMLLQPTSRTRLILKTHNIHADIGDLPIIPQGFSGKSVYIVRDPRDVAISWAKHLGKGIDETIERMALDSHGFSANIESGSMQGFLSSWSKHVYGWERFPNCIVIRYEDLLEKPEESFKKILEQYGYDYSQEKFEHALSITNIKELKKQEVQSGFKEATKYQREGFFGSGIAGNTQLSLEQRNKIETSFKETMIKYGYL